MKIEHTDKSDLKTTLITFHSYQKEYLCLPKTCSKEINPEEPP